jgi:hypothetical protein
MKKHPLFWKGLRLGAVLLMASTTAAADGNYVGPITFVGTLGDGTVFIEFPSVVSLGACSSIQVRISSGHPARKEVLAVAMSAFLTGTIVSVQTDSCAGAYPTLSGTNSWIYLRH